MRNQFVYGDWVLEKVSDEFDLSSLDCGDADLNDYFRNDAGKFRRELLTQTCVFHECGKSVTVDAYRRAVGFYERNDFARMLTDETNAPNAPTVPLFFDLMRLLPA